MYFGQVSTNFVGKKLKHPHIGMQNIPSQVGTSQNLRDIAVSIGEKRRNLSKVR